MTTTTKKPGTSDASGQESVQLSHDQIASLWVRYGGPKSQADMAAAIAQAESGGHPSATNHNTNGSYDIGLFQINTIHGPLASYELDKNIKAAIVISGGGFNWRPWCTAYSDAACGTKGGTYKGAGSPYIKFLTGRYVHVDVSDATLQALTNASAAAHGLDPGEAVPQGITGGAATGILHGALGWTEALGRFLTNLLKPSFWLRVGQGIIALGLIVLGLVLIFRKQIEPLAEQGAKVAEVAAVA